MWQMGMLVLITAQWILVRRIMWPCGQSPISVLLSLFDSVFFCLPVYLAPKWIPQLFRYPKCHKQGLNSTLANKYMVFNTWYWFSGNKNKNNKKLVIGHKGEKRKERPATHLPWSLGILSEESANRPSTGEEKTRARITSFEDGTGRIFLKEKIKIKSHKLPNKLSFFFF